MGPKTNAKAVAAREKQEQLQAERDARAAAERERAEAAEWEKGANKRAANKAKEAEDKAMEKMAKKAELNAMIAAEESAAPKGNVSKPKKKGKDSLDILNAALAAAPKTKAQKAAEAKKAAEEKAAEARRKQEEENRIAREEKRKAEEDMRRKAAARGIVVDHSDSYMVENTNRRESDFVEASGLEAAIDALSTGPAAVDNHPERRQKAMYNAYFDAMLPTMKEEYPGLKLSQYKERIFELWKKAPENPMNQQPAGDARPSKYTEKKG